MAPSPAQPAARSHGRCSVAGGLAYGASDGAGWLDGDDAVDDHGPGQPAGRDVRVVGADGDRSGSGHSRQGYDVNHEHCVPVGDAQPQDRPAHARRPSTTAQPAIPSATTPSSHQAPRSVLAASPANTATARYAQSRFCVPSPTVAADPSQAPIRRLATPSAGSKTAVPAVSTSPATLVSARSPAASARTASTAI